MAWHLESITYNLLTLQSPDFKRTYVNHLLTRRAGRCRFYLGLSSIVPLAVNWNVVEVVTSSWGFLWIVVAAGAGIARKIYEHFEVHELG